DLVGGDAIAGAAVIVVEAGHAERFQHGVIERLAALHVGDAEGDMVEHCAGPQCRDIRAERPWRMRPFLPSLFICFIMRCISMCCFSSLLTSATLVPEPVAIRCLREALMSSGLRRSSFVIEEMIACWRFKIFSSILASPSCR